MFEFLKAGGFLILPILICSVIALAIVIERFLALRARNIVPENIISKAHRLAAAGGKSNKSELDSIRNSSLIGKVLAAGLENSHSPRHIMKENLEETGRHAAHEMDKYMTALGTIAAVTPLLGLLGTVVGMIEVFSVITKLGVGSPTDLAGGISTALITTAAGISVAVPALIFHRYFKGRINDYVVKMEQEALKLVELASDKHRTPVTSKPTAKRPPVTRRSPAVQKTAMKKAEGSVR
jgi:biopolymer transport protein ExbB